MNGSPRVTVVVPVYNAGAEIERCFRSLENQTSEDFEVVFVDDGSTDDSPERLNFFFRKHPEWVRVVTQQNSGVCEARHRGVLEARAEYICFMDNDDFFDEDYIEVLLNAAEKSGNDIVICGYRRVDDERVLFEIPVFKNREFTKYNFIMPWGKIIRKSLIVDNDIRFLDCVIGEDDYFSYICYLHTDKVGQVSYIGYNWYMNRGSVSNTRQYGLPRNCDLLYTLNKINEQYVAAGRRSALYDYAIYRRGVWHLLWSGAGASPERFLEEQKRFDDWFSSNGFMLKMHFFDRRLWGGEAVWKRMAIEAFSLISKFGLMGIFSKVYCHGR